MFGRDIIKSIFSDKAFQSYSFRWKKDLLKFFCYTKLYTFWILLAQCQKYNIQATLHKALL